MEELNCKSLMIGDWVLHDGEPYQIRQLGIYGEDRGGEDYPAVCVGKPKGIGLIVERNEIEPISLTTEILEKNGFHKGWNDSWKLNNTNLLINENNGLYVGISIICLRLDYVHELQHIMRLCGIEKEIEL